MIVDRGETGGRTLHESKIKFFSVLSLILFVLLFLFNIKSFFLTLVFGILIPGFLVAAFFLREYRLLNVLIVGVTMGFSLVAFITWTFNNVGILINKNSLFLAVVSLYIISIVLTKKTYLKVDKKDVRDFVILLLIVISTYIMAGLAIGNIIVYPGDDAVIHSLKIMEIINQEKLVFTPKPYMGAFSPYYPSGYHSAMVFFNLFTEIPVYTLLLISYLLFLTILPFSVYFLTGLITKRRVIAIASAIFITTEFTPIEFFAWGGNPYLPNFYNLLVVMGVFLIYVESSFDVRIGALTGLLFGGMLLIHPHAPLVFFLFVFSYCIFEFLSDKWSIKSAIKTIAPVLLGIMVFTIFAFPSIQTLFAISEKNRIIFANVGYTLSFAFDWGFGRFISINRNYAISILSVIGIGSIILKKKKNGILLLLMVMFIILWAINTVTIQFPIPVYGTLNVKRIVYLLFPFHAIFAGIGFYVIYQWIYRRFNRKLIVSIVVVSVILSTLAGPTYSNYEYLHHRATHENAVTKADVDAMGWIGANTPENSIFLNDKQVDAGQSIPIFTNRSVMLVQGYLLNERLQPVLSIAKEVDSPESLKLIEKFEIDYVYIGSRRIYNRHRRFDAFEFLNSEYYRLVYYKNGVWIFKTFNRFNDNRENIRIEFDFKLSGNDTIDIGTPSAKPFLLKGWSKGDYMGNYTALWSVANKSSMVVALPTQNISYNIVIAGWPYHGCINQTMNLRVNNNPIVNIDLIPGYHVYEMPLPKRVLSQVNKIEFGYGCTMSPYEYTDGRSKDKRKLGVAFDYIKFIQQ